MLIYRGMLALLVNLRFIMHKSMSTDPENTSFGFDFNESFSNSKKITVPLTQLGFGVIAKHIALAGMVRS